MVVRIHSHVPFTDHHIVIAPVIDIARRVEMNAMNTVVAADVAGERGDALSSLALAAAEDDKLLLTSIPLSPPIVLGVSPLPVPPATAAPETRSLVAIEGEITITDQVRALNLVSF